MATGDARPALRRSRHWASAGLARHAAPSPSSYWATRPGACALRSSAACEECVVIPAGQQPGIATRRAGFCSTRSTSRPRQQCCSRTCAHAAAAHLLDLLVGRNGTSPTHSTRLSPSSTSPPPTRWATSTGAAGRCPRRTQESSCGAQARPHGLDAELVMSHHELASCGLHHQRARRIALPPTSSLRAGQQPAFLQQHAGE